MRDGDLPFPTVTLDVIDGDGPLAGWEFRPVIACQDNLGDWVDVTCSFTGLRVENGPIDGDGNIAASRCTFQLDNRDGRWARWTATGELLDWSPGNAVAVWIDDPEWVFYGFVARWDDVGRDVVEVECFDTTADLAMPIGVYTPGANGDRPYTRLEAIMAAAGYTGPTEWDIGIPALTAQPTDRSPLDEARTVVQSDGGLFFVDVDGRVRSFDRTWRNGRADQPAVPEFSTTVANADWSVWNAEISSTDIDRADMVILNNVADIVVTATAAGDVRYTYQGQTDHQWTTEFDGQALADHLLAEKDAARLTVRAFDLYLMDPLQRGIAAVGYSLRLGDRITWLHEQPAWPGLPRMITVSAVVTSVVHDVTPGGDWVTHVGTGHAFDYKPAIVWDAVPTPALWDDVPPELWGY